VIDGTDQRCVLTDREGERGGYQTELAGERWRWKKNSVLWRVVIYANGTGAGLHRTALVAALLYYYDACLCPCWSCSSSPWRRCSPSLAAPAPALAIIAVATSSR
jgi:hypothetical protein